MKRRSAVVVGSALLVALGGLSDLACSNDDSEGAGAPSGLEDAALGDAATSDASASNPADATLADSAPGRTTDGDVVADSASAEAAVDAGEGQDAAADAGEDAAADSGEDATADGGGIVDAGAEVDAADADADAGPAVIEDIFGCGTPHDCASGQTCVIAATAGWDGGDLPAPSGCKLEAANGTLCKSTPLASDVQVCAALHDGGFTPCPTGTTCQTVAVFAKNFGACLSAPADGCNPAKEFVPFADVANYCFAANTTGGCTNPNIVCCDKESAGIYTATCAATVADCH